MCSIMTPLQSQGSHFHIYIYIIIKYIYIFKLVCPVVVVVVDVSADDSPIEWDPSSIKIAVKSDFNLSCALNLESEGT